MLADLRQNGDNQASFGKMMAQDQEGQLKRHLADLEESLRATKSENKRLQAELETKEKY